MAVVTIVEVNGKASLVRFDTGELVNVTVDMTVAEGDILTVSADGFVTVSVDGELRTLPAGQSVTFPLQLDFTENNSDDEFAVFDESINELTALLDGIDGIDSNNQEGDADFLDVLAGDGDILESLEATAAGLDGGAGTDGGSNFVRVDRINEKIDPVGFQFDQSTNRDDDITPVEFSGTGEQAQDISLTLDAIGLTNDTTPTLSGITSAIPGSTVTLTVTDSEGNTQVVTAIVQDDGTFSVDVPNALADGEFTVDATVLEPTGNTADSSTTGEIDAAAPTITINAPGSDNDTTPTLSGTTDATPESTVTLTVTDSEGNTQTITAIVQADGTYSVDVPAELAEGEFTVNASVTDEAGNTATADTTGEIDTTAPSITIDAIATGNDTTPTLSGTTDATPGSIVTLTITDSAGNTQTVTATVQTDGTYSVDVPAELAEGEFTVNASVTDEAGNTAATDTTGEIDTTAPSITIDAIATDNDTTPTLSGTTDATPGSIVTLTITDSEGNTQTVTATVQTDGTYSVDVPVELAEGEFTVNASVTDEAGNTATADTTGEIDTTAPSITIDTIATGNDTTPTLSGTTDAASGSTVTLTITDSVGNTQTVTAIVQADGTYSVDVPAELAEGEFTVNASVTDEAGNTATADTTGEIDTTAPSITIDTITTGNDTTPTLSGTTDATPGSTVTLTITDSAGVTQTVTAIVQADGTYSVDVPAELAEGEFTVNASVTDEAGNTATADATGEIDTTAPSITIDAIATGNDTTPALSGTTDATPGSTVTLTITDSTGNTQTVTATVQADGTYSVDVPVELAEGEFTVNASVTDEAGNTATADTTGEIDTTAPSITIDTIATGNDTTPTLSGTTDAASGSTVTLTITDSVGNTQTVTAIVQADGTYSADVPAELAEGVFTVNASVTDESGNSATADTTGEIDTTAPLITIDTISTGNDTTPNLSGTTDAAPGSTVTLTITDSAGVTQTVTAIVQADGTYSADVPAELAEGEFTVNASVTDEAGNTANTDAQGAIDVKAPTISLNDPGINGDATPTLSGLTDAVPGSTITLTVTDSAGVTQTFTTTVLADGTFTVEVPNAVAEGTYSVTAEVTDGAGNTAQATASGDYDSTSPSTTVNQPAPTNDTTPNVSGETDAPAGSEVVIVVTDSEGNEQTIVTTVGADGTFNEDVPTELSEGEYTVDVTVTTPAGNSSTTTVTGEIDTTAPIINLDPIGSTNDETPVINGDTNAEPGAIVTLEIVHSDGTKQTLTATVQEDGRFSAEVPQALANGEFTVTATVSDVAGNTASTSIDAVINTQGPNVVIETGSPTNGSEGIGGSSDAPNSEVVVVITDSDGNSQTITGTTDENGNFNVAFPPGSEEGEYEIEVTVTDENGNSSTATATTVFDTTPPIVNIDPQTDTNDTTPTISGNTDLPAGSEVAITVTDSQGNTQTVTAVVDENGNFSADLEEALAEGNYEVSVEATDAAGNTTTAVDNSGNIDTTAPALSLDPQTDGSDTTPTISGSTDLPPGSTVTIAVTDSAGNTQTIDAIVDENGDFSVDVQTPLTEGEYTVEASATDEAGNTTTVIENGGNIDTTAPTLTLENPGSTGDTTPTLSGTTDLPEGSTVTLVVTDSAGNTQTINALVDANGSFSVDVPNALADGDFTVTATATDSAGNTANANTTGSVDSEAPLLTLDTQGATSDVTPTITGTSDVAPGTLVTITVVDANGNSQSFQAAVQADGTFSADVPSALAEGDFTVTATVSDAQGNTATANETNGSIDTQAPIVTVNPLDSGNDTTPVISGSTDLPEGAVVVITVTDSNGDTQTINALVDADGNFATEVLSPLPEGDYSVEVTATDDAGNSTTTTEDGGNIDTTAPVLTLNPQGTGNDETPNISGSTDLAPGSTVTLTVIDSAGNTQTFDAIVDANGDFSADVPNAIPDGSYTVTASASDDAGNTTTTSDTSTLDTSAPALTLDAQVTVSDTTPTISGTSDLPAGSTVTLSVTDSAGNTQTFTALVGASGNFSADVPAPLAEGDYSVTATATDSNGNSASVTDNNGIVDTVAPVISLDALGSNNDTTPIISGTTDLAAGESVTLSITDSAGNTQTVTATVGANGNFTVDVPVALAEGDYTVTATATDDAGNSASANATGTIDTTAPSLTLDAQGLGNDTTPTISGSTDLAEGSVVSLVITDSAGNIQTVTATVDAAGNFTVDVPGALAEGSYSVEATATDEAGNSASVLDNSGVIDITPPELNLDELTPENNLTPTISGTTNLPAGAIVTLTVVDSAGNTQTFAATVQTNGSFAANVPSPLTEGDYTVTATAQDAAGNQGSDSETGGSVDTTAPVITLDQLGTGNDNTPTISGNTDLAAGSTVTITVTDSVGTVQTFTATVQGDGTFSASVPSDLAEGSYTVVAEVTDGAGNTGSDSETGGVVDTTSPAIDVAEQGIGNDATPTISGTTDQPTGSTVSITVTDNAGNIQTLSATVQSDGSFSVDVPTTLAEGTYTVQATVVDEAGNTASDAETGVIDTISPVITLDEPGTVSDSTPTISGTADLPQGSTVQITVVDSAGNTQVFFALVGAGGVFSADVPAAMAEGNFTVSATATDEANNSTTDNEAGVVDTLVPTLTIDVADTTNDATPLITGTTDEPAGSVVTILVTDSAGATQTLSAVVQGDGTFSISPGTDLAEGDFTVSASISDEAGNTATASDAGSVDTTAPTINLDAQGTGNDTTPTITGSTDLSPGSSVTITVIDSAGAEQTFTAIVDSLGNFSADVPNAMADGNFDITATATDAAGNSASDTTSGNINTAVPNLTLDPLGTGNDTTPTISGTTDIAPGSAVSISVTDDAGNTQTFDAIVQANGTFSVDVPAALSEGNYSVTASATDGAGNTATANENGGVIDTTAPAAPTVDAGNGTEITGTAEAGAVVNVDVDGDGTPDFTVIADGDGNWSVTPTTPLADGVVVTATATDEAGNTSGPASDTVDAVAPVVTINDVATNDTTPALTGSVDDPTAIVVVTINGTDYTATNNGDGSWTLADDAVAALADGSYTATVTATDADGNVGSNSGTVVIDTTPPAIPTVDAGNGTEITGTAEAGATVNVDVDGNGTPDFTVIADGDGNWSVTPTTPLADGVVVTATAVDEAGNVSAPASDTVDAVAPVVAIDDLTTNDATPELTGTVDDPSAIVVVTIDGVDYTATNNGDGSWTLADDAVATLADGSYTATVTATDADGNVGSNSGTVVIDTTPPAIPTVDAGNGTEITGTAEAGATVNVDVDGDGTPDFTVIADGDGNWSITPDTPLADGVIVTVTATDAAGNISTPASDTVDATAPVVAFNDLTTNDTTPALTGSVDDPTATVVVTINGADYTATNKGDGTWTLADDAVAALAEGSYTATVTATDPEGNVGTNTGTVVIDTTAPAAPTVEAGNGTEITGIAEAGATVNVDVNGDGTPDFTVIADGDGNWSVTPDTPLADGVVVTATATDEAGNTSGPASDTVDAVAPIVTINDVTTNDTRPALTGTVDDPTATVVVTIEGNDYTATNNGDGTWTLADDVVATLAEGSYPTSVTATDDAGNTDTDTGNVVVDTTAPTVTINDLTTNDITPELTGTVNDPNAVVVVTIDGNDYTATNNGDGTWTLADNVVATLAEGSYPTSVTATDAAGNTVTNTGTVIIDTTAPTVAINDLTTNDTTPELTGTVNDPNAVVVVTIDGNDYTATNNGDGTWTLADNVVATLAEGSYPTSVSATDAAGNTVTNTGTVVIDTTAPTVAINDLTTNDTTPELTGTVDDPNAVVVVTIDGNDYTATNNGDGTWTLADNVVATLAEGSYPTSVSATDAAGNTVTNTGTVVIDTTAPTVAINDLTTNDTTPELTGTVDDPNAVVVVTIDGNDYTATNNGDGTWTLADNVVATLAEGSYPTSASATDAAGNTVTNTGTVVIDTTAPTVAINDLTTNDTTPELTGTVDDPNAVVVVTIDGNDYTATNNGDGTWTLADNVVATLAEGSYPTSVSATDAAGNTVTNTGTVIIDTTAPTVAINDLTTNDTTPELTGTVNDPNAVVVATIDGNDYTATNNGDGTWTLADNIVALLAEGNYTAVVTATDAVGNSDSASGSVVIDTSIDENNNGQTVTFDSISNDSGVAGDFITSDSTLVFNGTVDLGDNTTLTVTVDGTSYTFGTDPELTIDGSGNWSLDLTGTTLPAGTYAVVATVTDEAGNSASTASQNVIVQALDAINDGNTVDMGEPVVTVNPPETTSDVQVIGLAESTGGVDASASFTVSPNNVGEVLIEVEQIALVAVADAYIVEVYDENGQLVYQGVSANSQLADVGGLEIFNVTGDETISFSLSGLDAGTYSVVVRNDENTLEDLLDSDGNDDVNLNELGTAGVVLGPDNQSSVLDTVETSLNGGILGILPGTVGTQVRGVLETLLDTTTSIGAGDLAGALTGPLGDLGLTGLLDDILTVLADALLSNTLILLQDTDITTTLTEYTYTGDLVAQGNLIDGDISGVGADTILDGAQVTLVTNAAGDSVAVPATGTVTIQGNYGVLEIAADGTYTYTADGDRSAIGQDEVFNYTLSDGETSDIAALTITISGSDFPPVVAQTDNNDMELGAQTAIVNTPITDSDFQVLGLAEGSPAAGSPEASTTLTVDAGFFGEVVVEVSQTALVAVADSYRIDIVDSDGNVVATAMTPDNPLIGDVAGVNLIGVTGDDTLVAKFSGLPAGDYTVVVRNDESALETLFDQDSDGSITLTELGDGGVVLGEENQDVVLTAVEDALNGTNASVLNGLGLGTVVRNLVLEPALSNADTIGAGDVVSTITTGLNLLGLGALVDTVLDAVAAALLSNTLTLLQSTDITSTLTEYAFEGSTTTSGNVIDAANTGDVTDSIAEGGVVTQVTHTNGESVTVLGTGLSGITIEGDYGDLTIFEDGSYTYVANGVRDGLGSTDSFSYIISDGRNTSTANLNFNLSGQGVSADSARAELTYDFATDAGLNETDALSHGYLLGLGGSFSDTSSTFAVATNTTQDISLNVDNGSLLSLVSSLTVTVEKFENGAWEAYRVFPNGELVSLLGIDGDTVLTVDGLTEGLYRLSMSGTTGVGVAGSISVDLSSTINYLDQFEVSGIQTATGNLFENDILFGPTYDVTVSADGTIFQNAAGGITLVGDHGTLQIDETGAYTYTPDNTQAVFSGTLTDTFTYRIAYPDGTVEQAEFNVFVTASGEGVPEVVTTTSSESVSASDSSGTVVTDEPTAPDVIDLTAQTLQTVDLNAETRLATPENEPTAPLLSTEPVESITPVEGAPETITLPEEEVSTLGTTVGDGFGGGDTIDLSGTKLDTVDIGGPIPTAPDEGTSPLSPEASTPISTAPEPVTSGTLPEDTITLPEEGDIVTTGPVTEVTVDVVDIDLPPEDLILPSTEPTSTDSGNENTSSEAGSDLVGDTSKEGSTDVTTASPTESEVLKTAIDKLPPLDI